MRKAGRRRRRTALPARPHASPAGCPRPHTSESPSTQRPRGTTMIGRSTKKPPPSAEDYARRDPGSWSSAAPPPQARRYGESRSAWEARRPKAGTNAAASVYVPHFMQENVQRVPGKPFELRVHVRMKNKDLVHVFSDLREDQTFLSLRELCRKTFPTFGRRLSALEWYVDGQRVCPSFSAGRMASLAE